MTAASFSSECQGTHGTKEAGVNASMAIKAGVNTVCGLICQQHVALLVNRVAYSAGLKYNSTQPTVL